MGFLAVDIWHVSSVGVVGKEEPLWRDDVNETVGTPIHDSARYINGIANYRTRT